MPLRPPAAGYNESRMPEQSRIHRWLLFAGVAAFVVAVDLWTKRAVFEFLEVASEGNPPRVARQVERTVIPGCFDLQANYNYGAFSGWFSRHTGVLTGVSIVALIVLAAFFASQFRSGRSPPLLLTIAIALVWGGTLGNLHDRATLGAVRDWIKWYVVLEGRQYVWPNFNIADSCICVGVALWLFFELRSGSRKRGPEPSSEGAKRAAPPRRSR